LQRFATLVGVNKARLRTLGLLALLILPHFAAGRANVIIPQVAVDEPEPVASPSVRFSIPRYELSQAEREVVAACLILEAASQGEIGLRGVMAVIRNRARGLPELFEPTVLRKKQFSALNKVTAGRESLTHAINRAKRDRMWPVALQIVDEALQPDWHDPTGGATHYTRSAERTLWTRALARTVVIGAHSFYR
jgi:spore germination cell wall hydrolase CwlJ-like protein